VEQLQKTKGRLNKSDWIRVCFKKALYELEILSEERSITNEDYDRLIEMQEDLERMMKKY
jgi:hypothetical protein